MPAINRIMNKMGVITIKRRMARLTKTPFINRHDAPFIVHCSHHKVGTSWFGRIFQGIANEYGLNYQDGEQAELAPNTELFLQNHSRIDRERFLVRYKGTHMVRDPRDIVVSGYYYHLWTSERWVHIPMSDLPREGKDAWWRLPIEEFGHMTYQEYLNSLSREDGLEAEMKRAAETDIKDMANWDYEDSNFLELKYEDLIKDEQSIFENIFVHYEFNDEAIARSLEIVDRYSFRNRAKRRIGQVDNRSHLRSGRAGQWKEEFSETHRQLFKELCGKALVKLGYEDNLNW